MVVKLPSESILATLNPLKLKYKVVSLGVIAHPPAKLTSGRLVIVPNLLTLYVNSPGGGTVNAEGHA